MESFIYFLLWVVVITLLLAASCAMSAGWFLLGIPLIIAFGALGWFTLEGSATLLSRR